MGSSHWATAVLSELADDWKQSWKPAESTHEFVDHYSIPAFDNGRRPSRDRPSDIKSNKRVVAPDCVLVSRLNPVTPRIWAPTLDSSTESVCSGEMLVLRPKPGVDRGYLEYLCKSPFVSRAMLQRVSGTTGSHQRVSPRDVLALAVPFPPLKEQRAIAEVLASLDDALELCWRSERLIEEVAQAVAEEIEQSGCVRLREVAELRRDSVQPAELLGRMWSQYSIPAFDEGHRPQIDLGDSIASAKFRVAAEAVLVSKLNPSWHRVWLPDAAGSAEAICSTEFMPLVPLEPFSAASLWSAVLSRHFNSQLRERASGTSGSHQRVRPDDMLACSVMDIRLLSDPQAEMLNLLAEDLRLLRLKRDALRATRDELLPKLVSGDLRIEAPERLLDLVA